MENEEAKIGLCLWPKGVTRATKEPSRPVYPSKDRAPVYDCANGFNKNIPGVVIPKLEDIKSFDYFFEEF